MGTYAHATHEFYAAQAITAGQVLTTTGMDLYFVEEIKGVVMRAASATGQANVKLEYETSHDGTNWDHRDDNPDVVASTLTSKPNNAEGWNAYSFPPPFNQWIRFVVTNLTVLTDTLVDLKLVFGERNN